MNLSPAEFVRHEVRNRGLNILGILRRLEKMARRGEFTKVGVFWVIHQIRHQVEEMNQELSRLTEGKEEHKITF